MPVRSPTLISRARPRQALAADLREVVDEANAPLCLLPEATLLRQGLRHRAVAVLLRDRAGRTLLQPHAGGWNFSAYALPRAREAAEDCCRRLLGAEWNLPELAPRVLARVDACAATGMAFLTLFTARVTDAAARALAAPGATAPEGLPLLDAVELAGLARQEPPVLAPLLRHAVLHGWLGEENRALPPDG